MYQLTITDLEWKLVYVGSANSEDFDQELDSCMGQSPRSPFELD
jgi:hypothetical protein